MPSLKEHSNADALSERKQWFSKETNDCLYTEFIFNDYTVIWQEI